MTAFPSLPLPPSTPPLSSCPSVSLTQTPLLFEGCAPSSSAHRARARPTTCGLVGFFSAPLYVSQSRWRQTSESYLPECLALPCCLPARRHAHTDDQQTLPAQRGPLAASFPPSRDNLPSAVCSRATQIFPPGCLRSLCFIP